MSKFAYQYPVRFPVNGTFIVKNISKDRNKTISIFGYPIKIGQTRDLLKIPNISESDIRASLLKGVLRNKLMINEIEIIDSDVDLLAFNDTQKKFLQDGGVSKGLEIFGLGGLTEGDHSTLRQLIHFIDEGPADGFESGAFKVVDGQPFPSSITWFIDNTESQKIVEKLIVRDGNQNPTSITWNMYDNDGITIIHTIIDTINYNGTAFESTRTRTIS